MLAIAGLDLQQQTSSSTDGVSLARCLHAVTWVQEAGSRTTQMLAVAQLDLQCHTSSSNDGQKTVLAADGCMGTGGGSKPHRCCRPALTYASVECQRMTRSSRMQSFACYSLDPRVCLEKKSCSVLSLVCPAGYSTIIQRVARRGILEARVVAVSSAGSLTRAACSQQRSAACASPASA
jgi:hypothetical protein